MCRLKVPVSSTSRGPLLASFAGLLGVWLLATAQPLAAQTTIVHLATSANTFLHVTQLDHPAVNDNPAARLIVSQIYNPLGDVVGVPNPHPIGVFYTPSNGRWSILNEDLGAMPGGATFLVLVAPPLRSFIHRVATGTASTTVSHPLLDPVPDNPFFVTHNRTPDGEQPQGPLLDTLFFSFNIIAPTVDWKIELTDTSEMMAPGTEFNIFVPDDSFPVFEHWARAPTISGSFSRLNHPALNGNLNAQIFAYQLRTVSAPESPHPHAMAYDIFTNRWAILNTDDANFVVDSRFIIGFVSDQIFAGDFEDGDTEFWTNSVP